LLAARLKCDLDSALTPPLMAVHELGNWLSFAMRWLHMRRYKYAEDNADRWRDLFVKCAGTSDPFPHTKTIEWVGFVTRIIKFVLPLVGGVLLIIGAWKGK
jgi:hypothetical protein